MKVRSMSKYNKHYKELNKKCPFCGHKAVMFYGILSGETSILCMTCGADIIFRGSEKDVIETEKLFSKRFKT